MRDEQPESIIEELFSLYGNDVYRFALYTLHDEQESMDVVQETFYRAFKSLNQFRHESNPKTWLLHIARNYMYDLFRKKKSETRRTESLIQLSDTKHRLDTIVELLDVVNRLSLKERQVVTLRLIDDLSVRETAQTLGWSEASVRVTQHKAVKKLRKSLIGEPISGIGGEECES